MKFVFPLLGLMLLIPGVLLIWKGAKGEEKKHKKRRTLGTVFCVIGGYAILTGFLQWLYPSYEKEAFSVEIWAQRTQIGPFSISNSALYSWVLILAVLILALILRFTVIRNMQEKPRGIQNLLEIAVETLSGYAEGKAPGLGEGLPAYLFAVCVYLTGCAILETIGFRSPASDITVTLALGLVTFFLINFYGIRRKGVWGRVKSMAQPTPIVFPIKIVSDVAVPVSLACRLFGNMLGGMIVMDLLYSSLGTLGLGFPSLVGLYFNVFHPIIQGYIFITLSLTFIGEATE